MATALAQAEIPLQSSIQLKTIVMATDFSAVAARALLYAELVARQYHANIHVVHVLPPRAEKSFGNEQGPRAIDLRMQEIRKLLRNTAGRSSDIPHETWLETGDVGERILAVCERVNAELVVVGTQSDCGFQKLFLGSTAEKIFRSAACPVLTVGSRVAAIAPGAHLKEVLYLTDFLPESERALPYAISIAHSNGSQLTLLHVVKGKKPRSLSFSPLDGFKGDFERLLRNAGSLPIKARFALAFDESVPSGVRDYAARLADCLIVLGVREAPSWTTYLPDIAQGIATLAPWPVLTVRSESARGKGAGMNISNPERHMIVW